jgi:hypothetical protein
MNTVDRTLWSRLLFDPADLQQSPVKMSPLDDELL